MNTITVKNLPTPYNYNENYLVIDGISITEWFTKYKHNSEGSSKFDLNGLYPAWGDELEYEGDKKFIYTLLMSEEPEVVPLLVCPDDLDLDCTVLAADAFLFPGHPMFFWVFYISWTRTIWKIENLKNRRDCPPKRRTTRGLKNYLTNDLCP